MTISTSAAQSVVQGNGATYTFVFSFIPASSDDIEVSFIDTDDSVTILDPSSYTLVINSPAVGQIWGIGGSVTYPLSGSPIANGTSLLIRRVLPLTQTITISNQGDFAPEVIEEMGDTLMMQIQQIAARTGQMRGTWASGVDYNFGDVVQDGANGNDSLNYYMCAIANTSSTWAADLAAGDWSLVIQASLPSVALPLAVVNGGTGVQSSTGTGNVVLSASPTFTGTLNGAAAIWSGNDSAAAFLPTGTSIPTNGIYLPATNQVGISANSALGFSVGYYTATGTPVNSIEALNCGAGFYPVLQAIGSDTNMGIVYTTKGNQGHIFNTNGPQTGSPATQVVINHTANAVNYVSLSGGASGSAVNIAAKSLNAANADVDINYTTRGAGNHVFQTAGTSGVTQFIIANIDNAVNFVQMNGAVSGSPPFFVANGSDSNIGLGFASCGNGSVIICSNFDITNVQLKIKHTASSVNPLEVTGGSSGNGPTISTSANNAPINITPNGSGVINAAANIVFTAAAAGVTLKRGANGRVGTVTLTGTTAVTVNNTSIATSDLVVFSLNTVGGTVGAVPSIKTITAATGFTVAGTAGDTSTYNYGIIKSAI